MCTTKAGRGRAGDTASEHGGKTTKDQIGFGSDEKPVKFLQDSVITGLIVEDPLRNEGSEADRFNLSNIGMTMVRKIENPASDFRRLRSG